MKQVGNNFSDDDVGICPNCKYDVKKHTSKGLAECTIEFLKSGMNN